MEFKVLTWEQWLDLLEPGYNAPLIRTPKDEAAFQAEIRKLYVSLVNRMSAFGEEGDYYGVSDFGVSPDLRDRATTKALPANHAREFDITILTREFYESKFLTVLHQFLASEARDYRIIIAQDFAKGKWALRICLTLKLAQVYCTNAKELSRLKNIFTQQ